MRLKFSCYALTILLTSVGLRAVAESTVDFNRDIRPLLSDRCFQCHGPDEQAREANLRFDLLDDDEEGPFRAVDGSQVIKPKDLEGGTLWYRLTTDDESERMPPKDSHKKPFSGEERELFKRWILQGAEYDAFWAFVPPKIQTAPAVRDRGWCSNRIDQFVKVRLETEGLQPRPRAHKRTLIRRLTFDLTGLPPTREEVRQFLDDRSENGYENLADRLIGSPRYGEHMAKYWLDLVRFADTNGIHQDHYREMTPYRDWVIRSFNENLNFDKFVIDQLAGDLHEEPTTDQLIASGFNRLHLVIDVGTALPAESFSRNVVDRVTAVGTAFMGMTVGCAVCHDHKYDPLTQRDFYQFYAFFNNIDATPETPSRGPHAPFLRLSTPAQNERLQSLESSVASSTAKIQKLKDRLSALQAAGEADGGEATQKQQALASASKSAQEELERLKGEKKSLEAIIPVTLIMKERKEVRPTYILVRGQYDQPGERVERNTPAFLPPTSGTTGVKTRMDLARWLTDKKHPLTARVTVNRFWQQFFGAGLVLTSEDFGAQGEVPSHPALLDDLAIRFVKSQWDVKALVKSIVISQTYQQSSRAESAAFRADPKNRLLARGSRFRLDSETIRDQILATSGLLNRNMFGRSVKPPQPPDLWKNVSMESSTTYSFKADTGDRIYRRSLYSFWKRALPPPQMTIFDAPTRESCTARRERTNTPLQALVLMNEGEFFKASKQLARRVLAQPGSEEERLRFAYETITSHLPDATELASLRRGLGALRTTYREDVPSAKVLTSDVKTVSDEERVVIAAYTMLVNSLFNLDVAKTRQ